MPKKVQRVTRPLQRIEQFQAELLNLKSLMHPYVVGLKEVRDMHDS